MPIDRSALDRLRSGRMSRRETLALMAALGIAAVPVGASRARAAEPVNFFTWSGYELPQFHQAYIDKYDEQPVITFFGGTDEAREKLRAGFKTDIAHPCSDEVGRWYDSGIIRPIDTSRLTHWGDYFDIFKNLEGTKVPDTGETLFIPFDWGNSSVLYRTDLVQPEEDSWAILYDERYKGRLATYDQPVANVQIAAGVLGYKNIWNLDDEQLANVRELIRKQRDLLRFVWTSQSEALQALAAGEIVAMYAWNDAYAQLKKDGVPVAYMKPKEGARNWVCGLVLVKDNVSDDDRIYDFLNAMMAPESGAYLIAEYGYGNANGKAYDLVPKERLEEIGLTDPQGFLENGIFLLPLDPAVDEKYVRLWEEVQAGG